MKHKMLAASPRSHGSWHLAGISSWEPLGQAGACKEGGSQGISAPTPHPLTGGLSNSDSNSPVNSPPVIPVPGDPSHWVPSSSPQPWGDSDFLLSNLCAASQPPAGFTIISFLISSNCSFPGQSQTDSLSQHPHFACFLQTSYTFVEQQGVRVFSKPK